ncbi:hypothetical protein [Selenomonas ruminantium]|uniref:hypothetical protein n=1 Tax=Selenomonas ruminantium TaxID=971 RepID=UPI0026F1A11B|nr:hypothetical protein [Selenomonas ruminantium]
MFLYDLSEEEKELYIDLAIAVMEANGDVDDSETELLKRCCHTMQVKYRTKAVIADYVEVLKKLKDISDESTLKKITIEIITLMYADNDLANEENEMLDKIQNIFDFSSHTMGELIFATKHMMLSLSLIQGLTLKA